MMTALAALLIAATVLAAAPEPGLCRLQVVAETATSRAGPPARPLSHGVTAALVGASALAVAPGQIVVRATAAGAAGICVWVLLGLLPRTQAIDRDALVRALPGALDLLAACLEAGLPLRSALPEVIAVTPAPLRDLLAGVDAAVAVGVDEAEAWTALAEDPSLGLVARDVARALRSGTPLATVIVTHAADARRDRRAVVESSAKSVAVRTVLPLMVCYLPAFVLIGVVPIIAGTLLNLLP